MKKMCIAAVKYGNEFPSLHYLKQVKTAMKSTECLVMKHEINCYWKMKTFAYIAYGLNLSKSWMSVL